MESKRGYPSLWQGMGDVAEAWQEEEEEWVLIARVVWDMKLWGNNILIISLLCCFVTWQDTGHPEVNADPWGGIHNYGDSSGRSTNYGYGQVVGSGIVWEGRRGEDSWHTQKSKDIRWEGWGEISVSIEVFDIRGLCKFEKSIPLLVWGTKDSMRSSEVEKETNCE